MQANNISISFANVYSFYVKSKYYIDNLCTNLICFMESTVKQRLISFLAYKGLSQARFAQLVGVSSGYVNAIRRSIQPATLHKITMQFPELDAGWLLTGEGEMLKGNVQKVRENTSGVVINGNNHLSNSPIDNRQYYSDSPDVLRAQIDLLDERIKEKDAQIKEKDAQINRLLDILSKK